MTKIRLIASLLALLCIIQMCLAGRIQRDASNSKESNESSESNELSENAWTQVEIAQYNAINNMEPRVKEILRAGVSYETFEKLLDVVRSAKDISSNSNYAPYCDVLDPDVSNKLPPPSNDDKYLKKLNDFIHYLPAIDQNPFAKSTICPYIRNPAFDEDYVKSMGLTRQQHHQIQDIRRRYSNKTIAERVSLGRKLCKVAHSQDIIANISKVPKELSAEQLISFDELLAVARNASESSRLEKYENICTFLGEIVIPEEQAEALKIPVELYNKIVVIRKENANGLEIWNQIKAWVSVCQAIDESDGVTNKTYPEEMAILFHQEQKFLTLIRKSYSVENSKKIGKWREACDLLLLVYEVHV